MAKGYFELRKKPTNGSGLTTDMMRHLHTRQHLGTALVVCDQPTSMQSAARKQWLRLARYVQKQRAATLDADKILKYTHAVTHMQNMNFTARPALSEPEADVFFLSRDALDNLPTQCLTVYVVVPVSNEQIHQLVAQAAADVLIVDYDHSIDWQEFDLRPKLELEASVGHEWQQVEDFLATYHIDPQALFNDQMQNVDAIDEALDILLGASQKFLRIAGDFQRTLELARPLKLSKKIRQQYDAVSLLAHRVQALTPGTFTQQFLETYSEDDTFFLHDRKRGAILFGGETLAQAVERHLAAGRIRLAEALKLYHAHMRRI